MTRQLVLEAPGAGTYFKLAITEEAAGHHQAAMAAARQALRIAKRTGDLDRATCAHGVLAGESCASADSYRSRMLRAGSLETQSAKAAYGALRKLKLEALRLDGRATAFECVLAFLTVAARAQDTLAGLRFARELAAMAASSFSSLALALAHERVGNVSEARDTFAETLRLAKAEGDIHRATKATAGLLRTNGEGLVTAALLRWTMSEAVREPGTLPDSTFLRATLGFVAVDR
jgi:hypothetical protein